MKEERKGLKEEKERQAGKRMGEEDRERQGGSVNTVGEITIENEMYINKDNNKNSPRPRKARAKMLTGFNPRRAALRVCPWNQSPSDWAARTLAMEWPE